MRFIIPGAPVGKGRPRARKMGNHIHMYTDTKTLDYEKYIQACYQEQIKKPILTSDYIKLKIEVFYPIPKQTSKKNTAAMIEGLIRPDKKPDIDNICKVIMDALNNCLYQDDKQVIEINISKFYAAEPRVEVSFDIISKNNPTA